MLVSALVVLLVSALVWALRLNIIPTLGDPGRGLKLPARPCGQVPVAPQGAPGNPAGGHMDRRT